MTDSLRHAGLDDIPVIMEMATKLYQDSTYNLLPMDRDQSVQMLEKFIIEGQKDYLVLLSHDNGKPVGVIAAHVFTPLFSTMKIATESVLWLEPEYRSGHRGPELLEAYEYWAKLVGAKIVQYGLLASADPRIGKLYERRGAKEMERIFYKEL